MTINNIKLGSLIDTIGQNEGTKGMKKTIEYAFENGYKIHTIGLSWLELRAAKRKHGKLISKRYLSE